jgi:hypothetical protein
VPRLPRRDMKTTPMARRLRKPRSEVLQRPSKLEFKVILSPTALRRPGEDIDLYRDGRGEGIAAATSMGNGALSRKHSCMSSETYYESRVSHYTVDRLDVTPGQEGAIDGLEDAHGRVFSEASGALLCCHTTAAVVENRLQPAMMTGVTCETCHGRRRPHRGRAIRQEHPGTVFNPRGLGASESVDFAALPPHVVGRHAARHLALNVRFRRTVCRAAAAGIRMIQISCVTCHDPHKPLESAPRPTTKCLACHLSRNGCRLSEPGRACPVGTQTARRHMPRTKSGMYAHFSDHRIRGASRRNVPG